MNCLLVAHLLFAIVVLLGSARADYDEHDHYAADIESHDFDEDFGESIDVKKAETAEATARRECHRILTSREGTIQNPRYPYDCPEISGCLWFIDVGNARATELTVSDLHLQTTMSGSDRVEIWSVQDMQIQQYKSLSGTTTPLKKGVPGAMIVRYKRAVRSRNGRFHMTYRALTDLYESKSVKRFELKSKQCGQRFNTDRGIIENPNYPARYSGNDSCLWIIPSKPKHTTRLHVREFTLNGATNDFVEIFTVDGTNIIEQYVLDETSELTNPMEFRADVMLFFSASEATERGLFQFSFERIPEPN